MNSFTRVFVHHGQLVRQGQFSLPKKIKISSALTFYCINNEKLNNNTTISKHNEYNDVYTFVYLSYLCRCDNCITLEERDSSLLRERIFFNISTVTCISGNKLFCIERQRSGLIHPLRARVQQTFLRDCPERTTTTWE